MSLEKSGVLRSSLGVVTAMSLGFLASGCGEESGPYIEGGIPSRVMYEDTDSRYSSVLNMWENEWYLVLEQCGRVDNENVDEDGCVTVKVEVKKKTYNQFSEGDEIVFNNRKYGTTP